MANTINHQHEITETLVITDRAIQEIKKIKQENNIPSDHYLRLGVKGGGCSGLSYVLAFDNNEKNGDKKLILNDLTVIIDPKSLFYLSGTTLEFNDGLNGRGFVFNNPNAAKTCGCGHSFGV